MHANEHHMPMKPSPLVPRLSIVCSMLLWSGTARTEDAVSLLDGKLKLDLVGAFVADDSRSSPQSITDFKARDSDGWGSIPRGL
jgi:hypothetical protein